jgi:hypothetical protein
MLRKKIIIEKKYIKLKIGFLIFLKIFKTSYLLRLKILKL